MTVVSGRKSANTVTASGPTGQQPTSSDEVRTINLALQGGGAHGAFTWVVLDRLLEEKDLGFEGLSATSAGAMNAAALPMALRSTAAKGLARRSPAIGSASAMPHYWGRCSLVPSIECWAITC